MWDVGAVTVSSNLGDWKVNPQNKSKTRLREDEVAGNNWKEDSHVTNDHLQDVRRRERAVDTSPRPQVETPSISACW